MMRRGDVEVKVLGWWGGRRCGGGGFILYGGFIVIDILSIITQHGVATDTDKSECIWLCVVTCVYVVILE